MGLEFDNSSVQWFMCFRKRICKTIGIISSLDGDVYDNGLYKFLIND